MIVKCYWTPTFGVSENLFLVFVVSADFHYWSLVSLWA